MAQTLHLFDGEASDLAGLFGLLSDQTRVRLLGALATGEASVGELQRRLALPQPTISHHLTILRTGQLVVSRRGGKKVFYTLGTRVRLAPDAIHIAAGGLSVYVGRTQAPPEPHRVPDGAGVSSDFSEDDTGDACATAEG